MPEPQVKGPDTFSPFDAPVNDVKSPANSAGMKMEEITDSQLDGKTDSPNDAPIFEIPSNLDDIPSTPRTGPVADPSAPGSGEGYEGTTTQGQGGSGSAGATKIDDTFRKEFSEYTAKWLIDILFRLILLGVRHFAKIDRSEVLLAIDQGHIHEKFLDYIDQANSNVDSKLDVTEKEKQFVIEPLKYFIEVKNIQMSPGWMVAGSLLMVVITLGIKAWEMKKENKRILDRIIRESAEIRKSNRRRTTSAYAPPETATFSVDDPVQEEPTFTVEPEVSKSADPVEVILVTDPEEEPNPDNE